MTLFVEKAPKIGRDLMAAFSLDELSAAAILGNLGHESGGFKFLQEKKPLVAGSRGGWGWAQWTGPRRRAFEAWVAAKGLDPSSDEANFGFLKHELETTEAKAIPAVKAGKGLEAKVRAFEAAFERAGVKHYPSRYNYAGQAYTAMTGLPITVSAPPPPKRPASMAEVQRKWAEDTLAVFEVRAVQERLRALGYFMVGKVDGDWGISTRSAIIALQTQAGITADGHYGPETKAALADDTNRRVVSEARANTTAKDLRNQGSVIAIEGNRVTWTSVGGLLLALAGAAHAAYTAPADLPFGSSVVLGLIPPPFGSIISAVAPYLLAFVPLAYSALAAQGIVKARVAAERTGLHNGEPEPASAEPAASGALSGLLGSLLGRKTA